MKFWIIFLGLKYENSLKNIEKHDLQTICYFFGCVG